MPLAHRAGIIVMLGLAAWARATTSPTGPSASGPVAGLDEQVRALREAGEPVEVADLKSGEAATPPERNAARTLLDAAELVHAKGAAGGAEWPRALRGEGLRDLRRAPTPEELDKVRQVADAHGDALALLDRLPEQTRCDWGPPPDGPLVLHRGESPFRLYVGALGKLCFFDGVLAAREGDLPRAWRRAAALRVLAGVVARHPDPAVSSASGYTAAFRADLLACVSTAEGFDPEKLGGDESVRELIRGLLDGRETRDAALREFRAQRVALIDAAQRVRAGTLDPRKMGGSAYKVADYAAMRVGVPMWPAALMLLTGVVDIVASHDLSRARGEAELYRFYESFVARGLVPRHLATTLAPWYSGMYDSLVQLRTDETLAAVALAVRSYRGDHAGAFPPTLQALVPAYLPAVPDDPSAKSAAPLRYRPDGNDPLVWSVGDNGVDDGGRDPVEAVSIRERNAPADRIIHLKPKP